MNEATDLNFYQEQVDILRILDTVKKRAESFYSNLNIPEIKNSLIQYFISMDKSRLMNDLEGFFFNEMKQIETLVNYSIKEIITMEKLIKDLENSDILIPNSKSSPKNLKSYLLSKNDIQKLEKNELNFSNITISAKINTFYTYFIANSEIGRHENLSYTLTNTINAFRIIYSHGNADLTEKQLTLVSKTRESLENNQYFFYDSYYQVLYKILAALIKRQNREDLLL